MSVPADQKVRRDSRLPASGSDSAEITAVGRGETTSRGLPSVAQSQVWLDFDGTLTRVDLLDHLISKYSRDDSWKRIEEQWRTGTIGSRECLALEFGLLDITQEQLAAELAAVELDPGAAELLDLLGEFQVPTAILSDGIDAFIDSILRSNGAKLPRIRANRLNVMQGRFQLECPHSSPTCTSASAHCKCSSAQLLSESGRMTIYVGDGRSDLCASRRADVVFAKGALAAALTAEGRAFIPFTTLRDVAAELTLAWKHANGAVRRGA